MKGHCILSHGFESGPDATKVAALAEAAQRLGWTHERPDYTDLDAKREVGVVGAFVGPAQALRGLFLMAPPIWPGEKHAMQAAQVPVSILHGWHDELIPAQQVVDWARERNARLLLVDDSHRLSEHVGASADAFAAFLQSLPA